MDRDYGRRERYAKLSWNSLSSYTHFLKYIVMVKEIRRYKPSQG